MRSRLFPCVALAAFAFIAARAPSAHAADPKAKSAKKKGDDAEDKSGIGKTLQWEEKVMGPDDKGAELDKIRKAQAINKAAAEKAERDKAVNAAREAKEKEAAAKAGPTTTKRGGDVALPTLPDEGPGAGKGKAQHTEVSPKLDTAAAAAPPPVLKPADDKFIDKLLKEDSGPKKKRGGSSDDKALIDMLAYGQAGQGRHLGQEGPQGRRRQSSDRGREGGADARDQGPEGDARVGEAGDSRIGARAGADGRVEARQAR